MNKERTFVGFGFGAIQAGLFLAEAFLSGRFTRLVVAEVNPARVAALRANNGCFSVNVAQADRRVVQQVEGVEIYNPLEADDATRLAEALASADEIATALPSVAFYTRGAPTVADLLSAACKHKREHTDAPPALVYTAENNNHAAEHLAEAVWGHRDTVSDGVQMLNTVIGKMSSVVVDPATIRELALTPVVPGAGEAFLVEAFNRILISRVQGDTSRGLTVFEEKEDLLPFEEAKLYGHNAIHAWLGYRAGERSVPVMSDLRNHPDLIDGARQAFMDECGAALVKKHSALGDALFTRTGFTAYAEDLLERMLNPWLRDPVDRIVRDPLRKLGWNDRLIGTIRLILSQGIEPHIFAQGARAALAHMDDKNALQMLREEWLKDGAEEREMAEVERWLK